MTRNRNFAGFVGRIAFAEINANPSANVLTIEKAIRSHPKIEFACEMHDDVDPGWARRWAEWAMRRHIKDRPKGANDYTAAIASDATDRISTALAKIGGSTFPSQQGAIDEIRRVSRYLFGVSPGKGTLYKRKDLWIHLVKPSEAAP